MGKGLGCISMSRGPLLLIMEKGTRPNGGGGKKKGKGLRKKQKKSDAGWGEIQEGWWPIKGQKKTSKGGG